MSGRQSLLRSPASDPQRAQVYRMEREFRGSLYCLAKPSILHSMCDRATAMYAITPVPRLMIYPRHKSPYAGRWGEDGRIWLNSSDVCGSGANPMTLIHELAHAVDEQYGDRDECHGPFWAGIYSYMLGKFHILPFDASGVVMRRWGVRRVRPELCSPRALMAHHERRYG